MSARVFEEKREMLKRMMTLGTLVTIAAVGTGPRASAQAPAAPEGPAVVWNNGITVRFNTGDDELQVGALIQTDGRFSVNDPLHAVTDTLFLRRVRTILQGRAARYFEFRLMPDFAGGTVVLFDAYFDTRFSNAFRIRVGKDKTPVGLEQLQTDYAVTFPERTLVSNLVPNRDIGIQAQGDLAKGMVSYVGALFNGVPDGTNGDVDTNSGKDLAGRLTVRPFTRTAHAGLAGLGIALGSSMGREAGALPLFKSSDQQAFFSYAPTATADGIRTRISPSAFYYYKAIGAFGEYASSKQAVTKGNATADIGNTAWEVTGTVVATAERATDRTVIPTRPFDPGRHTWGALQLAVRYSALTVDPRAFALGFANAGASRNARAFGIGATWFANSYVKQVLTFERTVFDGDPNGPRKAENAIVFRLQLNLQPSL